MTTSARTPFASHLRLVAPPAVVPRPISPGAYVLAQREARAQAAEREAFRQLRREAVAADRRRGRVRAGLTLSAAAYIALGLALLAVRP